MFVPQPGHVSHCHLYPSPLFQIFASKARVYTTEDLNLGDKSKCTTLSLPTNIRPGSNLGVMVLVCTKLVGLSKGLW